MHAGPTTNGLSRASLLNSRNLPIRLIWVASLLAMAMVALPARADEVRFNDLGDKVSAKSMPSASPSTVKIGKCGLFNITILGTPVSVEGCMATIVGPASFSAADTRLVTLIGGDNGNISDAIIVTPDLSANTVHVLFASDPDLPRVSGIGVACTTVGGCQVIESGGIQDGVKIKWSNGVTDTVHFQSDVVPEPSSLLLLGSGLLAIAGYLKKRLS